MGSEIPSRMSVTLEPEDILTPEELAARLKVRKTWVVTVVQGRLPSSRPERRD
jgi:hypothetical protein